MLDVHSYQSSRFDRRDHSSRDDMLERVYAEFREMPCLRLTPAQTQRLLALRADICARVLARLVADGQLTCEDQRYRVNDARSWPTAGPTTGILAR
jgi:hypothetical protein